MKGQSGPREKREPSARTGERRRPCKTNLRPGPGKKGVPERSRQIFHKRRPRGLDAEKSLRAAPLLKRMHGSAAPQSVSGLSVEEAGQRLKKNEGHHNGWSARLETGKTGGKAQTGKQTKRPCLRSGQGLALSSAVKAPRTGAFTDTNFCFFAQAG